MGSCQGISFEQQANPAFSTTGGKFDHMRYQKNQRNFIDNDSGGLCGTGGIIGREEEPFTIVRHWAGMESVILITQKLLSGLSSRFV